MEEKWKSYIESMAYVEGGTFWMGSDYDNDAGNADECPVHKVLLDSFYMGIYQVTQDIYKKIIGINPSKKIGDQKPVEHLLWAEAIIFCNQLSKKEGLTPVYELEGSTDPDNWDQLIELHEDSPLLPQWESLRINWEACGYRLPTEAEWEYAARGGEKSLGYKYAGSNDPVTVAWHRSNSRFNTYPVGGLKPNELGLYDMSGNVWEWCWDRFDENYYIRSPKAGPKGPENGEGFYDRVIRGGTWIFYKSFSRVTRRSSQNPTYRGVRMGVGLRVVASAKKLENRNTMVQGSVR